MLTGVATVAAPRLTLSAASQTTLAGHRLVAAPSRTALLGPNAPATDVWAYNGRVPGPELRLGVGQELRVVLENRLVHPTTLHWHGMRVPNGMDGVPHLTQPPVPPNGTFEYRFRARNPGTFWYHPHFQSAEQLDRGLQGVIVVEDEMAPEVDRDLVWVLDDWRLGSEAQIVDDFGDLHDASHQGRIGNTATVGGVVPGDFAVTRGERIRLRLVNVANAWIFGLDFRGHDPMVIAYDGHAVAPHRPENDLVIVGPSQRVDVLLDMNGEPGERHEVLDRYYRNQSLKLLDIVYGKDVLRRGSPRALPALPQPDLPEPVLEKAERHRIVFTGGAMGGLRSARYRGQETDIRTLAKSGKVWAVNGVVASRHDEPPMLKLSLGRTYEIEFVNDTAFPHPVHLHGHPMKVLTVGARPVPRPTWRDTLLMAPRSSATVAVVADNPGLWMLHCHIPEHQEAGMMTVVAVG